MSDSTYQIFKTSFIKGLGQALIITTNTHEVGLREKYYAQCFLVTPQANECNYKKININFPFSQEDLDFIKSQGGPTINHEFMHQIALTHSKNILNELINNLLDQHHSNDIDIIRTDESFLFSCILSDRCYDDFNTIKATTKNPELQNLISTALTYAQYINIE